MSAAINNLLDKWEFIYFKSKRDVLGFVFAAFALLFQPFFKVALGRTIWNIVDVIVAVGLLYLLISTFKKKQ